MTAARKVSHIAVRPEWLALHSEPILDPDLPIVDAHHHIYDRDDNRYLVPHLLADLASGHRVEATVYVECRSHYRTEGDPLLRPVGETDYVVAVTAEDPQRLCAAIVGHVDLSAGAPAAAALEAQIEAGKGRFRGVRNCSAWHPDPAARGSMIEPPPDLIMRPAFREGFAALQAAGLSFDAWLYHTQIDELIDLARQFPEAPIVLNHLGGPIGIGPYADRREEVFATWRASIRRLAECGNVHIKLGGLGMRLFGFDVHEGAAPADSRALAAAWGPYVETCIEAFGTGRAMFESNFPVDKGTCSYATLWNAFKRIAAGCSADERRALFSGNARRFYRIEG